MSTAKQEAQLLLW